MRTATQKKERKELFLNKQHIRSNLQRVMMVVRLVNCSFCPHLPYFMCHAAVPLQKIAQHTTCLQPMVVVVSTKMGSYHFRELGERN